MKTTINSSHDAAPAWSAVRKLLGGIALASALSGTALAGQLVYTPVNPSFGGNPFNGSYLMSIAQQQASKNKPDPLADLFTDLSGTLDSICTAVDCENPTGGAGTAGAAGSAGSTSSSPSIMNSSTGPLNSGVIE